MNESNIYDLLQYIVVGLSITAGIYFAVYKGGRVFNERYKELINKISINALEEMVKRLPVNLENFTLIEYEFSKLKCSDCDEAALSMLWDIFTNRFARINKAKQSINPYAGNWIVTRIKNTQKSYSEELREMDKKRCNLKTMEDMQQAIIREKFLIQVIALCDELISRPETEIVEPVKIGRRKRVDNSPEDLFVKDIEQ